MKPPVPTARLASAVMVPVVGLLLLAACGPHVPRTTTTPPSDLSKVLTITVRNDQLQEVRTWLWVDSERVRLGDVRGNQSATFYFRLDAIRRLHLEFDVTLGQRCVTTDASFGPGESVNVRIPSNLVTFQGVCRAR